MAIRTTCYMDGRNLIKCQDPGSCRLQMLVSGGFWSTALMKCCTEQSASATGYGDGKMGHRRVQHLYGFTSAPPVNCTGKSNYVPVHAMKAYRRRRSKAPLIPNPFLLFPNAWIYSKPTSETEFFSFFHGTSARFRSMAFPLTFLQPSLFFSAAFQIRIWNKSTSYLQTACSHLSLGHGSLARGPPCCITRPAATFVILCVV